LTENATKYEWLYLYQAVKRLIEKTGLEISKQTLKRWGEKRLYGIIMKKFGRRYVIRADTLPDITEIEE